TQNEVNITDTRYVTLSLHKHKICGIESEATCSHIDGISHEEKIYIGITNEDDFEDMMDVENFVLTDHTRITKELPRFVSSASHFNLCLNGFTLTVDKGINFAKVINDGVLSICDCQNYSGMIKTNDDTTGNGAFVEVSSGSMIISRVRISSFNTATFEQEKIAYVHDEGRLYIHDTKMHGNDIKGDAPYIDVQGEKTGVLLDKLDIYDNNIDSTEFIKIVDTKKVKVHSLVATANEVNASIFALHNVLRATLSGIVMKENKGTSSEGFMLVNNSTVDFVLSTISDNIWENNTNNGNGIINFTNNAIANINAPFIASANTADKGGAIYAFDAIINVNDKVYISKNFARSEGGAIFMAQSTLNIATITEIGENTAGTYGGAIADTVGSKIVSEKDGLWIKDNKALIGGAIYIVAGADAVDVSNIKFSDNIASAGSAIYIVAKDTHIHHNDFIGNQNIYLENKMGYIDMVATISDNKMHSHTDEATGSIITIDKNPEKVIITKNDIYENNVHNVLNLMYIDPTKTYKTEIIFDDIDIRDNNHIDHIVNVDTDFEGETLLANDNYIVKFASVSIASNSFIDDAIKLSYTGDYLKVIFTDTKVRDNKMYRTFAYVGTRSTVEFIGENELRDNNTYNEAILKAVGGDSKIVSTGSFMALDNKAEGSHASVLHIERDGRAIFVGTTSIVSNKSDKAAVYVKDSILYVGDKVNIENNKTSGGDEVNATNILLASTESYIMDVSDHKILDGSKMSITNEMIDTPIYKYWNEYTIASWNDAKLHFYLPEKVFAVDKAHIDNNERVYKYGTYSNVMLYVGSDYEELRFIDKRTNTPIATQYVARNVTTYTDKIIRNDIEPKYQIWTGPGRTIEEQDILKKWYMVASDNDVTIDTTKYVYLDIHGHFACGCEILNEGLVDEATRCEIHKVSEKLWYAPLANDNDLHDPELTNYVLTENVTLKETMVNNIATLNICLNGFTLTFENDVEFISALSHAKHISICDCKDHKGKITNNILSH
ncbi:MAG: hypothetical protein MJ151_01095, partial [Lachnospiraceae bacterium]|nr:hypothetical protein [Lachnospiraceae bacterium]